MKKILLFISLVVFLSNFAFAQDRADDKELVLSRKSKEIKSGIFWYFNDATGKWNSKKNTKRVRGWNNGNYKAIFIGEIGEEKYIFINHSKGFYLFESIQKDWYRVNYMKTAIVSNDEYNSLENLQLNDTAVVALKTYVSSDFSDKDFNKHLRQVTKQCSYDELLDNMLVQQGVDIRNLITFIRVMSEGKDVVRFVFRAPDEKAWISNFNESYFEIPYSQYLLLFQQDKSTKF